jgi:uncharacterized protein YcgL (UPF0745 family)
VKPPEGIPQVLTEKLEALKNLNRRRFDYVLARAQVDEIQKALEMVGLTKGWYYQFPPAEREELEKLAEELHYEHGLAAFYTLVQVSQRAAQVKAEGLDSLNEKVRQAAATDILDRVLGKPKQPVETESDGKLTVTVQYGDGEKDDPPPE